jgi:hypothetical protein
MDDEGDRRMGNLNILIIQNFMILKINKNHVGLTLLFYLHDSETLFFF